MFGAADDAASAAMGISFLGLVLVLSMLLLLSVIFLLSFFSAVFLLHHYNIRDSDFQLVADEGHERGLPQALC